MNAIARTTLLSATIFAIGVSAGAADALKDIFKDRFLVGTAVNRSMVTGTTFRRSALSRARRTLAALVKEQFNQISPENDLGGGLQRKGNPLLDFNAFPLRIMENTNAPMKAVLKVGYSDGIYGRTKGRKDHQHAGAASISPTWWSSMLRRKSASGTVRRLQ